MKNETTIHEGISGKRQLVLITISILLLGCIVPMSMLLPQVEADVPSATGSHVAYWHYQDTSGNMWSNINSADEDDGGTLTEEVISTSPAEVGYSFPVKANATDDELLDAPLYFDDKGVIEGEAWVELTVPLGMDLPDEMIFLAREWDENDNQLNVWSTTVSFREDGKYVFYIEIDGVTISAGHKFTLGVNFEAQVGATTVVIHTGGDSLAVLPLVVGSDGGDGDGSNGNGNGTNGNATNGDDDGSALPMIIIIVVMVLVLVVVIAIVARKRGQ
jgi:hypothetical protein